MDRMLHAPEFSERRVYRRSSFLRIFAVVLSGFGLLFSIVIWTETLAGRREPIFAGLFVPMVLLTVGVFLIFASFVNHVALSPLTIEYGLPYRRNELPIGKIRGRRRHLDKGGYEMPRNWHLIVESDDDRHPSLDFEENSFRFDAAFFDWFKSLPDLDEPDKTCPRTSDFGLV